MSHSQSPTQLSFASGAAIFREQDDRDVYDACVVPVPDKRVVLVDMAPRWNVVVSHADSSRKRTIIVVSTFIHDLSRRQPPWTQQRSSDVISSADHMHTNSVINYIVEIYPHDASKRRY